MHHQNTACKGIVFPAHHVSLDLPSFIIHRIFRTEQRQFLCNSTIKLSSCIDFKGREEMQQFLLNHTDLILSGIINSEPVSDREKISFHKITDIPIFIINIIGIRP